MVIVYGIPNCDNVKKSIDWFKKKKIPHQFHNFKTVGISEEKLLEWINVAGLDIIINKRSTTWRNLSAEMQKMMADPCKAAEVALAETSIIKRPIVESNTELVIGFNEKIYESKFAL